MRPESEGVVDLDGGAVRIDLVARQVVVDRQPIGLTRKDRMMLSVPGLRIQAGDQIVQAELE